MSDQIENDQNRAEKEPLLLDHDYDGIRELDHFLPRWWLGILYGSMLFAVGYVFYYWVGPGDSIRTSFEKTQRAHELAQLAASGAAQPVSEAELVAYYKDTAKRKAGQGVFTTKCVACHGGHGEGGIGPNLTDNYWLHGAKITEILNTVTQGVSDKGMPPWGPVLSKEEIYSVVAYVKSLHGTNPPNPKAPQGERVQE